MPPWPPKTPLQAPPRRQRCADLARFGERFFFDVLNMGQFATHLRHQGRTHRRPHWADIILDHDGDVQRCGEHFIIGIATIGIWMEHVWWHRHNAVGAHLLRRLAEGNGGQGMAGCGGGNHRNLAAGFRHDNLDPPFAFIVRERRKLTGVGRPHQAVRPRLNAKAHLLAQAHFVQFITFGKRRHDDYKNATPGLLWVRHVGLVLLIVSQSCVLQHSGYRVVFTTPEHNRCYNQPSCATLPSIAPDAPHTLAIFKF